MEELKLEVHQNWNDGTWELQDGEDNVLFSVAEFDAQRLGAEDTKEYFAAATLLYEKLLVKVIGRLVSDIAKE